MSRKAPGGRPDPAVQYGFTRISDCFASYEDMLFVAQSISTLWVAQLIDDQQRQLERFARRVRELEARS